MTHKVDNPAIDTSAAVTQSWHHKFKSPKNRNRNAKQSKIENPTKKGHVQKADGTKGPKDITLCSLSSTDAHSIRLTYRIMRSLVTAFSYIDDQLVKVSKHERKQISSLYSCDISLRHWDLLDLRLKKKILSALLDQKKSITVQDLEAFQDIQIISLAILQALKVLECIMPNSIEERLFRIKRLNELDEVLCSKEWDELGCMVFVALMHHLAKILLIQENIEHHSHNTKRHIRISTKRHLEKIGTTFSVILFHETNDKDSNSGIFGHIRKDAREKKKKRSIILMLRHFIQEIKKNKIAGAMKNVDDAGTTAKSSADNEEKRFRRPHSKLHHSVQKNQEEGDLLLSKDNHDKAISEQDGMIRHNYLCDYEDDTLASSECEHDYECCFLDSLRLNDQTTHDGIDTLLVKSRKRLDEANEVIAHYRGRYSVRV